MHVVVSLAVSAACRDGLAAVSMSHSSFVYLFYLFLLFCFMHVFSFPVVVRPAVWAACRDCPAACPSGWTCRPCPCPSPPPARSISCPSPQLQQRLRHSHSHIRQAQSYGFCQQSSGTKFCCRRLEKTKTTWSDRGHFCLTWTAGD
jgi:hypothetical protein